MDTALLTFRAVAFILSDDEVKALRARAWQFLQDLDAGMTDADRVRAEVVALSAELDRQIAIRFGRISFKDGRFSHE